MVERRFWSIALLLIVTACGGSVMQAVPGRGAMSIPNTIAKVPAKLVIVVPTPPPVARPHYVSPGTKTLVYTIDGGAPVAVAVTKSNSHCVMGGTGLTCTLPIQVVPGTRTFTFSAYDKAKPRNLLSANTKAVYKIAKTGANVLKIKLGGIGASIEVTAASSTAVTGDQQKGFAIYGNQAHQFYLNVLDADGYTIVGTGSLTPTIVGTPDATTVATPQPGSNQWTLTSTYQSTDPRTAQSSSISVQATPFPHTGGTTVTANVPLSLYQPWIYAVDDSHGAIRVFDEMGNPKTPPGSPWAGVSGAIGIFYDPDNQRLYVTKLYPGGMLVYDPLGATVTPSATPVPFSGLNGSGEFVTHAALDRNKHWIYVAAYIQSSTYNGGVNVFDEEGNVISAPLAASPWQGLSRPSAIAVDATTNELFVADSGNQVMRKYDELGNTLSISGFSGFQSTSDMNFDPLYQKLYVGDLWDSALKAYDPTGVSQNIGSCVSDPESVAYDPHTGNLYVGFYHIGGGGVTVCDTSGNVVTVTGSFAGFGTFGATGIAIVP